MICFKNVVDDFYLNFIEKENILVEFYSVRGQNKRKIGETKLPLKILLDMDKEGRGNASAQQQSIFNRDAFGGKDVRVGQIMYRMKMRKNL